MIEKSNSQYDSFLFWRQPIPALELSELEDLGLTASQSANSSSGKNKMFKLRSQDEEVRVAVPKSGRCLTVNVLLIYFLLLCRLNSPSSPHSTTGGRPSPTWTLCWLTSTCCSELHHLTSDPGSHGPDLWPWIRPTSDPTLSQMNMFLVKMF